MLHSFAMVTLVIDILKFIFVLLQYDILHFPVTPHALFHFQYFAIACDSISGSSSLKKN